MQGFSTCLWFDDQAGEAAQFYTSTFKNSSLGSITQHTEDSASRSNAAVGSLLTIAFSINGLQCLGLNGGPHFKFTPSYSFFVSCESEKEIRDFYARISAGGIARMKLDKYPWAELYAWTTDRFGVEWQFILSPGLSRIRPALLFVDSLYGRGQEAVDFYTSIFPRSSVEMNAKDPSTGAIAHCAFTLAGQGFVLMEGQGQHGHLFNEAFSMVVECETQKEIDTYWSALLSDGGSPSQCGWLKDKFGVSWQVVPSLIRSLADDPRRFTKAMGAVMTMQKLDLARIQAAANS